MVRAREAFNVILRIGTQQVILFGVDICTPQRLDALIDLVKSNPVIDYEALPADTFQLRLR
ncbi:hypothetical protein CORAM0001_2020 [Corynebacterium amycolatum SK46]|nr:hypothetical protein CORAM0001_2020 [Corynebacterium amycolatum SK46]